MILQKSCAIGPDETLGEVYFNKLFPLGVAALLEAADLVVAGRHENAAGRSAGQLRRLVARRRVAHPLGAARRPGLQPDPRLQPGAGRLDDARRRAHLAVRLRKHPVRTFGDVRGKPGEIAAVTDTSIVINAQGGRIEVLRLRPEGGKKMNAGEFARSAGLLVPKR